VLQGHDAVDELRIPPRLGPAERLLERDHVGGGLLDDGVAVDLELPQDGRFAGPGGAGEDVRGHDCPLWERVGGRSSRRTESEGSIGAAPAARISDRPRVAGP
jgi:hypothetical protein